MLYSGVADCTLSYRTYAPCAEFIKVEHNVRGAKVRDFWVKSKSFCAIEEFVGKKVISC